MDVIRVADVPEASFDYYYSDEASDHEVRHEHADNQVLLELRQEDELTN